MTDDTSTNTVGYRVMHPDGRTEEGTIAFKSDQPTYKELEVFMRPHLRLKPDELFERVRVFHAGAYTDMFVDEMGHHKGLELNSAATDIYWNNMRTHDPEAFAAQEPHPTIVGIAILFLKPVWH